MHIRSHLVRILGFEVLYKGTEVDPAKINAIIELPPPKISRNSKGYNSALHIP